MGIFDRIKDAIWGPEDHNTAPPSETPVEDTYLGTEQATTGLVRDVSTPVDDPALHDVAAGGVQPVSKPVEIEAAQNTAINPGTDLATRLDRAAEARGEPLDWRHSIVDLMKAVGMDASLEERRELARELGYTGDTGDTAKMNTFLHESLMARLEQTGGRLPPDLVA